MTSPLEVFAGLSWIVNLILDIGAAYYCFKMTKITGGFRAWWLMIAFSVLYAFGSVTSVSYSVLISALSASSATAPVLGDTALFDLFIGLVASILLFAAMLGLYRTLRASAGKLATQ